MSFDFLKFFVGFAGGSFLTLSLVTEYPVVGSLVIGAMIGILLEGSDKRSHKTSNKNNGGNYNG